MRFPVPGFECRPKQHLIANEFLNTVVKIEKKITAVQILLLRCCCVNVWIRRLFVSLASIFEIQIGIGIA